MHVNVDRAGQDVQAGGVERLFGFRHRLGRADGVNQSILDGDAGAIFRVGRDDGAAVDDKIDRIRWGHRCAHNIAQPPSTGRSTPVTWRDTSLAKNKQALATSASTVTRFMA